MPQRGTPRRSSVLGVLLVTVCVCTTIASDAERKQLLQGVDLMESGSLARAGALFQGVAQSTDSELAARALFYFAQVKERQGADAEARAAYSRIVARFRDQPETVAAAQSRLRRLEGPMPAPSMALRPVAEGDDADSWASMTSDGRLLARADQRTGNIVVKDMLTGRVSQMLPAAGNPDSIIGAAARPVLSPDGLHIAYMWVSRDGPTVPPARLRVMPSVIGAPVRDLIGEFEYTSLEPLGWSRDGTSLFVTAWKRDDTSEFIRVSLQDRSVHRLKNLEWRLGGGRPRLSPDGAYIAYSAFANSPTTAQQRADLLPWAPQHIHLLPTRGGEEEREVVRGSNINESPIWSPDGRHLLFVSNRSGEGFGLYQVPLENGKWREGPSLVDANISGRIQPIGMTSTGTLYYVGATPGAAVDIFLADLRPTGDARVRAGVRIVDTDVDRNVSPVFSPDAERVAFKRRRPTVGPAEDRFDIVVYSLRTRQEEAKYGQGAWNQDPPIWFRDGTSLLIRTGNAASGWMRVDMARERSIDLESLAHTRLPSSWLGRPVLSPDDAVLYFVARNQPTTAPAVQATQNRELGIVAFDIRSGEYTHLVAAELLRSLKLLAVSPDGRSLAVALQRDGWKTPRLSVVSLEAGKYRDLGVGLGEGSVAWTERGLFASVDDGKRAHIVHVSVADGTITRTGISQARDQLFDVSRDGTSIVYSDLTRSARNQLWAYHNLLSRLTRPAEDRPAPLPAR